MLSSSKYRDLPRDLALLLAEAPPLRSGFCCASEDHGLDADDDAGALDDLADDAVMRPIDAR